MPRWFLLVLLLPSLLGGCHYRFKKYAPTLGSVRVQVITTTGPEVSLGTVSTDSDDLLPNLAAAAINVTQGIRSLNLEQRIAQAVDISEVNAALDRSIAQTLGNGPPFAYTTADPAPATLQVEVLSYGLYVPYLGAPGEFHYDLRLRIYRQDGKRVYSSHIDCAVGAGTPGAAAVVLGVVNNVKQIKEMTDEEIQQAFDVTAEYCGAQLVARMRKHAG